MTLLLVYTESSVITVWFTFWSLGKSQNRYQGIDKDILKNFLKQSRRKNSIEDNVYYKMTGKHKSYVSKMIQYLSKLS